MADLIEDLYRQNEWANLQILHVCRGLTDDQLDATAPGAFGSVRETLTHLIGAEAQNVRRLGSLVPEIPPRGAAWPGFEALEGIVRSTADGLIERARAVGGSVITVEEAADTRVEIEANVILIQAINHSCEHRSQICTILSTLGTLPSTGDEGQTIVDAWAWSDALGLARRVP